MTVMDGDKPSHITINYTVFCDRGCGIVYDGKDQVKAQGECDHHNEPRIHHSDEMRH